MKHDSGERITEHIGRIRRSSLKNEPIYQFYAELKNYKPRKWRRFQVSGEVTMAQLDRIMTVLFGMQRRSRYRFDVPVEENFKVCVGESMENEINQKALKVFRENPERAFCRIARRTDDDYFPAGWAEDAENIILKSVLDCENEQMTYFCDDKPYDGMPIDMILEKIIEGKLPDNGLPRVTAGNGINLEEINDRLKHC